MAAVDEVQVVGGVLIMEHDEAHLHAVAGSGVAGTGSALEPAGWLLLSPQAARQRAMVKASSSARNFFILIFPPSNILAKRQAGIAELTPPSYHTGLWGEIQLEFFHIFRFFSTLPFVAFPETAGDRAPSPPIFTVLPGPSPDFPVKKVDLFC